MHKCARDRIIIGDDDHEAVYIANIQIWDTVIQWKDSHRVYKRKREDEGLGISCKMRSMWESKKFTDAIVKCSSEAIPVHRAVLAASSPVFNAMFGNECME